MEAYPGGYMDEDIIPHAEICRYDFGPRGDRPPVKLTWYDGGLKPPCPEEISEGRSLPRRGVLFVGEKGRMLVEGAGGAPRLLSQERARSYSRQMD